MPVVHPSLGTLDGCMSDWIFGGNGESMCYTEAGACADGAASEAVPGYEYSYEACYDAPGVVYHAYDCACIYLDRNYWGYTYTSSGSLCNACSSLMAWSRVGVGVLDVVDSSEGCDGVLRVLPSLIQIPVHSGEHLTVGPALADGGSASFLQLSWTRAQVLDFGGLRHALPRGVLPRALGG